MNVNQTNQLRFLMLRILLYYTRSLCKAFASSQSATNQDLVKWSEQEDNRAIKETGLNDNFSPGGNPLIFI